jgi:hypothetical protein
MEEEDIVVDSEEKGKVSCEVGGSYMLWYELNFESHFGDARNTGVNRNALSLEYSTSNCYTKCWENNLI